MSDSPKPESLFHLLEAQARARPSHVATRTRRAGSWEWTTWGEWHGASSAVALSLMDAGVTKGDRVALYATSREEWSVAAFGALGAGAVTVPVYPTSTPEQVGLILQSSGARFAVVEGHAQLESLRRAIDSAPTLDEVAVIEGAASAADPLTRSDGTAAQVTTYVDLVRRGQRRLEESTGSSVLRERLRSIGPEDPATIVYTSGTTGPPRGVLLRHGCLLFEASALLSAVSLGLDDEQLLMLPLAHILAQVLVLAQVASGSRLAYADGPHQLTRDLGEVEPTFFAAVPRFFEKVYAVTTESARAEGPLKAALFSWAVEAGKESVLARQRGAKVGGLLSARARYADKLVLRRVRKVFGKRLRFAISGGAPLSRELAEWFLACGVVILEGYGLTEAAGASHVNRRNGSKDRRRRRDSR